MFQKTVENTWNAQYTWNVDILNVGHNIYPSDSSFYCWNQTKLIFI